MEKKYYKYVLAICLAITISQLSYSQRRVAIYSQNNTSVANMQWANMTHYVYAFFNPMDNTGNMTDVAGVPNALCGGSIWFTTLTFTNRIAAARAANANIKIIISTGGAPTGTDPNITTRLSTIMASAAARTEMVNDLGAFIQQYDLDGFDYDWEHPVTVAEKNNHQTFLAEMKARLNTLEATMCKDLELSIALNGETDHFVLTPTGSDYVNPGVDASVDFYHLMTYDASYTAHNTINPAWPLTHSPLIHVQEAVRDFSSPPFNWPKSKMVIGIPFYGKTGVNGTGGTSVYSDINAAGTLAIYNDADDIVGIYGFNACPTIIAKVNFAKSEGLAGVVVWEGSQDRSGTFTLQGCIIAAMGPPQPWEKTCCEKPNLGNDILTCNDPFDIVLNSNTTTAGATFVWTRILPTVLTINAAGSNTQNITAGNGAGTYVVARTAGTCTRRDTIIIISATGLPVPALGADQTLCMPPFTITPTNLASFPTGTTWQWQIGGVNITGETLSTIYASTPGTYTLVASLTGCTSSSDAIIITASSITPVDACRTTAGTLNLAVTGGVGPFTWYDTDVPGGTVIGTGTTYTTPVLPLPTTTYYYVEDAGAATAYSIGIPSSAPPTGFAYLASEPPSFTATNISMEFNVTAAIKIRSVDVFAWGGATYPTTFNIIIYNANNTVVYTSPNIVWTVWPGSALVTITLNANLVAGTYRMKPIRVSGGTPGFFHQTASTFPYTGGANKISITRQIGTAQYGPFYNWQISDFSACQRIIVKATVSATCSGVLPVEMLFFNAEKSGNGVLLEWATSSEENNDHYIIERSIDGMNFTNIEVVDVNGNSSSIRTYQHIDVNPPTTILYYRLAQYDINGDVNYSDKKVIDNKGNIGFSIAPNPFSNHTILIVKGVDFPIELKIYDLSGKLVHATSHTNIDESIIIGSTLKPGFYIIEVVSATSINQSKLIKE